MYIYQSEDGEKIAANEGNFIASGNYDNNDTHSNVDLVQLDLHAHNVFGQKIAAALRS